MNLESIVKILIYMVVVKVIMSKINKKKQGNNPLKTPKTPDIPLGSSKEETKKSTWKPQENQKNSSTLEGVKMSDLFQKSYKNLGPMEKMARRERELESRNK